MLTPQCCRPIYLYIHFCLQSSLHSSSLCFILMPLLLLLCMCVKPYCLSLAPILTVRCWMSHFFGGSDPMSRDANNSLWRRQATQLTGADTIKPMRTTLTLAKKNKIKKKKPNQNVERKSSKEIGRIKWIDWLGRFFITLCFYYDHTKALATSMRRQSGVTFSHTIKKKRKEEEEEWMLTTSTATRTKARDFCFSFLPIFGVCVWVCVEEIWQRVLLAT